jgi:hypothetical protein
MDLRIYANPDPAWIDRNTERLKAGGENFDTIFHAMVKRLDEIPMGKFFNIMNVQEQNREMFVRIALMYEQSMPDYRVSADMTRIYHEFPVIFIPKDATKDERQQLEAKKRHYRRLRHSIT